MSALGLYQVAPGSNQWLLGAPIFDKATLLLPGRYELEIEASGARQGYVFVYSSMRDGAGHARSWLSHQELLGDLQSQLPAERHAAV